MSGSGVVFNDFSVGMGGQEALSKINGAFSLHNHSREGQGGVISGSSIVGSVSHAINSTDSTNSTNAINSSNLTGSICGNLLSSIFEDDKKTIKIATAAKGDYRFQISGMYGGSNYNGYPLGAEGMIIVQNVCRNVPDGKSLKIKRVNYYFYDIKLRLQITNESNRLKWKSWSFKGDETCDSIILGSSPFPQLAKIWISNSTQDLVYIYPFDSWWIDFSIE